MTESLLLPIGATGFSVAFFHAAIPTHWLPFVVAARAQRWPTAKALAVTGLAGGGHIALTAVLGVLIVWLGIELSARYASAFPWIAGGAVAAFGVYHLIRQARGGGHWHHGHSYGLSRSQGHSHGHDHSHGYGHAHDHHEAYGSDTGSPAGVTPVSDLAAISSLLALLTFSPCEGFLPVYLSGAQFGWAGFALLTAILALATLGGMIAFTWLMLKGLARLRLSALERYESGILGGLLVLLGAIIVVFEP